MVDEYPSTDESDIDAFLEYAREKVAENNISYDSTSFRDFEDRLQDCIANHFSEDSVDSMISEGCFSGYVNEGGAKYPKSACSTPDNAYHRMKGIIARKNSNGSLRNKIQSASTIETDTSTFSSNDSRVKYTITSISRSKLLQRKDARNDSIRSDSSDSILDDMFSPQRRKRKPRRRIRNKKQLRGESPNPNLMSKNQNLIDQRKSIQRSTSSSSRASSSNSSKGRSSSNSISNPLIDATNLILPSLVKKGIIYFDIPKIERMLAKKSSKSVTMNRKHNVMKQLLKTRPTVQRYDSNIRLSGMALVRKLRAERKIALDAAFMRYSGEKQTVSKEPSTPQIPIVTNNESPKSFKSVRFEQEILVPAAHLVQSPSSLSSFSSIEERNRFQSFPGTTQRNASYSVHRQGQDGLRQNQSNNGELWPSSCLYSSLRHEAAFFPKVSSPFAKIKFSRLKLSSQYAELSTSSLSSDSWFDSGDSSSQIRSSDSNHQDENPLHNSNDSDWSEMSFNSDPQRFTLLCSSKKSPIFSRHETPKLPSIPSKAFDDSFDELVFRNQPKFSGDGFSNNVGDESPTGVMNFGFKTPSQKQKKDSHNALAFADEEDESHIFTDNKDDSFLLKSPGTAPSPIFQPVFFSPSRFEI